MAASTASGQPRPLEELTVTVAPSGMSAAASAADRTLARATGSASHPDRDRTAAGRGVPHRQCRCQRPQAVLASRGGLALPTYCCVEQTDGPVVELFWRCLQRLLASGGAQSNLPDRLLGHDSARDQRALSAVHLKPGAAELEGERLVHLREQARAEAQDRHVAVLEPGGGHAGGLAHRHGLDRVV